MVRIKERYLLVNIVYPPTAIAQANFPGPVVLHQPTLEKLTPQALLKAIRAEVGTLFGEYGVGALQGHLSVKYLSLATSTCILRCPRKHFQMVWAALTMMDRVPVKDGRSCIFRVIRVSGTMRKAEEETIRQARMLILEAKMDASCRKSPTIPAVGDPQAQALLTLPSLSTDLGDDDAMDDDDGR
ncbi:Rpp14 family [Drechmeria coniospora]|uniref:Rpp14 family n=1 Tax=Drechmeria coniospora TaxID=98403 RepID=A0A151GR55_DRECN|nr:Rpp14 family [Drechmeria coniospora]KYK59589.1 Rpp14 family [Drechmeria coniospora]